MIRFKRPIFIVLGISTLLLAFVVITPLGLDDLVYRSMTLDLLRLGRIPYIGSWDQNFPGIIVIHYLSILLFGESDISLRFLDVILQLGFAIIFYKLCRIWLRERTAAIAALLYIIYYVTGRGSLYCERDVYGIMAIVAGLYFVLHGDEVGKRTLRRRGGLPEFMIGGLLVGFSILIRPTFGLAYVFIGLFLFFLQKSRSSSWNRLYPVIIYGGMGAFPIIVVLLFYSAIPGGLQAMYLATIRFNLDVYSALHGEVQLLVLLAVFFWRGYLIPLAIIGLIALRNRAHLTAPIQRSQEKFIIRSLSRNELLLYSGLLFSFLGIAFVQPTYLAYHFTPFYLLLCPISAMGVEWLTEHIRGWTLRSFVFLFFGSLYFIFLIGERHEISGFALAIFKGDNPFEAAYAELHSNPNSGAVPENSAIHYLSLPGNDTGTVEVCSFEPALRTHLKRSFASSYILPSAIAFGIDGGALATPRFTDYQIAWRKAYVDSLRINQPIFIVIARNTVCWYLRDPYLGYLHGLPGFDSLLETCYRYDTAFGGYQIFRRIRKQ